MKRLFIGIAAVFSLCFPGCELVNAPLKPFIDENTAEVSLFAAGIAGAAEDFSSGALIWRILPEPETRVNVIISNPKEIDLFFTLDALVNGAPLSGAERFALTDEGPHGTVITIASPVKGERFDVNLEVKTRGIRHFRFAIPIVCNTALEARLCYPAITAATGASGSLPRANWVMQTPEDHPGINRVVIKYRYGNSQAEVIEETYDWDESLNSGSGGLSGVDPGREFLNNGGTCSINFPGESKADADFCFFSVEVSDSQGLRASAATEGPGFVAKTGGTAYYLLSDAINNADAGSSGNPTEIELLSDIEFPEPLCSDYTITDKHIKLTVPQNQTRTIKRTENDSRSFFTVDPDASLMLTGNGTGQLVLDGGAVWTGGAGNPLPSPSPAYGATNSGITAAAPLVIVCSNGKLFIEGGVVLQNNQNTVGTYTSGAVYSAGRFTMNGGIIQNNDHTDPDNNAGAILNESGTLHINAGEISGNNRNAIVMRNGDLYFSGGEIKNNDSPIGLQWNSTTVSMSGGVIKDNVHGIYIDNGHFKMSGGEISGNASGGNGLAIDINTWTGTVVNRSITLSGSARIDPNNVVVTHDSWPLQISGVLTGTVPVATIRPYVYNPGDQVLMSTDSGGLTTEDIGKFAIKQPAGEQRWRIDGAGKLAFDP
jgi:hypothetical protein